METPDFKTAFGNLKGNLLLLGSAAAALCLFVSPTLIAVALAACVFALIVMLVLLGLTQNRVTGRPAALASAVVALLGEYSFISTWLPSGKVSALAKLLHLPVPLLLALVGLLGCAAGGFALYRLSGCALAGAGQLAREKLPEQSPAAMKANLKRNWWLPLSALSFFLLNTTFEREYYAALVIALGISLLMASQESCFTAETTLPLRIFSMISAAGIVLGTQDAAGIRWGLTAIPFLYVWLLVFWKKMRDLITRTGLLRGVLAPETAVYGLLWAVLTLGMALSFLKTDAFYGTPHSFDIIYTSDSPYLVKTNAYLVLTNAQNDLRQPLFAVFAAPFLGLPYLLGFPFGPAVKAILLNAVQIAMLLTGNFLLSKLLDLTPGKRVCFMILMAGTYMIQLFSLMMEQYIVAYFWLVLCLYLMAVKEDSRRFALWGAGGTLLTSMILLPFTSEKNPFRQFKAWFVDMMVRGVEFVALILAFCRLDVILGITGKVDKLGQFTGKTVTMADKISQFTVFISSCFAAPAAEVVPNMDGHLSWQLAPAQSISMAGIVIFLLAVLSAILNREKISSRIAAGWVAFSLVLLVGLGWGTQENGLILYALYFGWAFLVLLVQLVEWFQQKLNIRWLFPAVTLAAAVLLAAVNLPAMAQMVRFAITHYPV